MKWIILTLSLLCTHAFATDYYVGGAGASDNNPGTSSQPFATIQKAASVAKGGDVVNIRAGLYRETITPTNSGSGGNPIIFKADNGAAVTVSGLNTADGGWTVHSGNIYKKSITLPVNGYASTITTNTSLMANQVFQNGNMMFEARWPKINNVDELFDISKQRFLPAANFQPTWLSDSGLPNVPGGLGGGTIIANGWFIVSSKTISSHSGNQINYPNIWDNSGAGVKVRKSYYVTGKLGLLTQAKEWHYESGTLYLWQEGGGSPSGVEYKARNWGFNLKGRSYITVVGLTFKGCEPVTGDDNTNFVTVDNIRASYTNHNVRHDVGVWQGYGMSKQMGIRLGGTGNVFKNSELTYSASSGIWIGANGRVENNLMHHIGYDASMGAPVALWGVRTNNQVITRNTFHTTGRTCFDWGYDWWADKAAEIDNHGHQNVELSYNDFSNYCLLNVDGGATYAWGAMKLDGSVVHHNWIHDCGAKNANQQDGILVGFYFDQATGSVTIHHNVMWNNGVTDFYHETAAHYKHAGRVNYIYNNTMGWNPTNTTYHSYVTYVNSPSDVMRNNICQANLIFNWGNSAGNSANSIVKGTNPQFVGSGGGGLNYRIQAGSPARNTGIAIPGITDGSVGAPDMGAYEFGGDEWVPGYKAVTTPPPVNVPPVVSISAPASNATFASGQAFTIDANATDQGGSVSRVEFFDGAKKLGEDLTSPYSFNWTNATPGTHTITAKATDNQSSATTSAPINVTVTGVVVSIPPVTAITAPANGTKVTFGTAVEITATATVATGSITKVEFYSGTKKLGEDTSSPYKFSWTNASEGAHALTVKAYDNASGVTTSTVITITITALPVTQNKPPVVALTSPQNDAQFNTGAVINIAATAKDADGSIVKVEFFDGTTKLGEDASSPYLFAWTDAGVGSHAITAKASDNLQNSVVSGVANITVNSAALVANPTVSAGEDITLFLPQNSTTLIGTASSPAGKLTYEWVQLDGPSNLTLSEPHLPSLLINGLIAGTYLFELTVTDVDGRKSKDMVEVNVTADEEFSDSTIPRYFTPNADGQNDTWQWPQTEIAQTSHLTVFNRFGQKVYESTAYNNSWDGSSEGKALMDDAYYYVIRRENASDINGAVRIIR